MAYGPQGGTSGIQVELSFFQLAWMLYFCTPQVEINGHPQSFSWGTHFIPLPPGRYEIKIYFWYLILPQAGFASSVVDIMPGHVRKASYYMWPLIFLPGSLTIT